jgi:uncharacterized protein YbaR (Trm112 family)
VSDNETRDGIRDNNLGVDPLLLEILACPCPAHAPVRVDAERELLVCTECGRGFPVREGIPVMLLDEAV